MWAKEEKNVVINVTVQELRGIADKIERRLRDDITKSGNYFESIPCQGNVSVRFAYTKP
jgi:hypothetical protein